MYSDCDLQIPDQSGCPDQTSIYHPKPKWAWFSFSNSQHIACCWLITFTPNPPSTIVLGTSCPLMMIVIAGPLVSTTVSPSSGFEKKAGASAEYGGANTDFSLLVNRGTNCNSRPNNCVIWQSCNAYHVEPSSLSVLPEVSFVPVIQSSSVH